MAKSTKTEAGKIAKDLSAWINGALEGGADPRDLSYIMAGIAADMGMKLIGDPILVMRIVLSSVSDQLALRSNAANDNETPDSDTCPVDASKLH